MPLRPSRRAALPISLALPVALGLGLGLGLLACGPAPSAHPAPAPLPPPSAAPTASAPVAAAPGEPPPPAPETSPFRVAAVLPPSEATWQTRGQPQVAALGSALVTFGESFSGAFTGKRFVADATLARTAAKGDATQLLLGSYPDALWTVGNHAGPDPSYPVNELYRRNGAGWRKVALRLPTMLAAGGGVAAWSEGRALVLAATEDKGVIRVAGGKGPAPERARDAKGELVVPDARAFTALAAGHVLLAGVGGGGDKKSVKVEVWLPGSFPKPAVVTLPSRHSLGNLAPFNLTTWSFTGTTPETLVLVGEGNLYTFDGTTFHAVEPPALSDGWVRSAVVDDKGTLWAATGAIPQIAYSEGAWAAGTPAAGLAPSGVGRLFRRAPGAAWEEVALPNVERVSGGGVEPTIWGPSALYATGSGAVWALAGGVLFRLGGPPTPARQEPLRPVSVSPAWAGCPSLHVLFYSAGGTTPNGFQNLTLEHHATLVIATLGDSSWLAARVPSKATGLALAAAALPAVGVQASLVCAEPKSVQPVN